MTHSHLPQRADPKCKDHVISTLKDSRDSKVIAILTSTATGRGHENSGISTNT